MKVEARAFTVSANGRLKALISPAAVSTAFHPSSKNPPKPSQYSAIWDTGATGTVITQKVIDQCNLKPISRTIVHTAGGEIRTSVFLINLFLPNKVAFHAVRVTRGEITADTDVLIGMDVIGSGDFAVTGKEGKNTFSFRMPSCECIDFTKHKKSGKMIPIDFPAPVATGSVGRNEPCPCGSGVKYKKCCGK